MNRLVPGFRGSTATAILLLAALGSGSCAGRGGPAPGAKPGTGTRPPEIRLVGIASWYGEKFHGRTTASGERYDMYALTAAHRTLPFGTRIRVTNLANGRQVTVRINDRGPFRRGRIIDLSYQAAKQIGMIGNGVTRVRLEILEPRA